MRKAQAALTELGKTQALLGEAESQDRCLGWWWGQRFLKAFPSVNDRDRGSGVTGTVDSTIAPHRWLKRPAVDTHGFPTLTWPRKQITGTNCNHTLWREVSVAREGRLKGRERLCLEHAEVKKMWTLFYTTQHLPQIFLSLFFPPTQKAMRIMEGWNTEALTPHTDFPMHSTQRSTARLNKPFDKKISSFIW